MPYDESGDLPGERIVRHLTSKMRSIREAYPVDVPLGVAISISNGVAFDESWSGTWVLAFEKETQWRRLVKQSDPEAVARMPMLHDADWRSWWHEVEQEWDRTSKAYGAVASHFHKFYEEMFPVRQPSWQRFNPVYFLANMIYPGNHAVIEGRKGKGKTDCYCLLCQYAWKARADYEQYGKSSDLYKMVEEQGKLDYKPGDPLDLMHSRGVRFPTNVQMTIPPESPDYKFFQPVSRMSEMMTVLAQNDLDGYFSIPGLDEAGIAFTKMRTTSRQNVGLDAFHKSTRKMQCAPVYITQYARGDLTDALWDPRVGGATTKIVKTEMHEAVVFVDGVDGLYHDTLTSVPGTRYPFNSKAPASFVVDIQPSDLLQAVNDSRSAALAEGKEWVQADNDRFIIAWCRQARKSYDEKQGRLGAVGIARGEADEEAA